MTLWLALALVVAALWWWTRPTERAGAATRETEEAGGSEGEPFDEPIELEIGDALDLHYFPPSDVGELVDAYLEAAVERGFHEVRIIHGRGRGVQRNRVRAHLARSPLVAAFDDAPGDRGGWGATIAQLRHVAASD